MIPILFDEQNIIEFLLAIKEDLKIIIGDQLGIYEIFDSAGNVIAEDPAIDIEYDDFNDSRRIKNNTGIEAIIAKGIDVQPANGIGKIDYKYVIKLTLRQYDSKKLLTPTIQKITTWKAFQSYRVSYQERLETSYGKTLEQVIIFMENNFPLVI